METYYPTLTRNEGLIPNSIYKELITSADVIHGVTCLCHVTEWEQVNVT